MLQDAETRQQFATIIAELIEVSFGAHLNGRVSSGVVSLISSN